jgi:hypothetical protein
LDRDWYTGAEEGTLVGDEEHNPLAQYEDLSILKQAEIATKQTVSVLHSFEICHTDSLAEENICKTSSICWCQLTILHEIPTN